MGVSDQSSSASSVAASVSEATNTVDDPLHGAVMRSGERWRRLGMHVRAVTPSDLAHALLLLLAFGALGWVIWKTWFALLPFQIGLVLAYIALPAVDALGRHLPRWLASLIVVVGEIAVVLGLVSLLVPALVREVPTLIAALPSQDQLQAFFANLAGQTRTLPEPMQVFIRDWLRQGIDNLQANLLVFLRAFLQRVVTGLFSVINTVSFLLGFLVLPAWLLAVLSNHDAVAVTLRRVVPKWAQPDLSAAVRIVDRSFGLFLRGQFLRAVVATILTWIGLALLELLGFPALKYKLLLSLWNGVFTLVPAIGPLIGAFALFLAGLFRSPQMAAAMIGVAVVVGQLENRLVASRIERRLVDIHPAILVPVLVAVSEFGLLWIFIASPLMVVIRDLFRYVYGRLSDPPLRAGVLPPFRSPLQPESDSRRARSATRMARPAVPHDVAAGSRWGSESLPSGRGDNQ